MFILLKMCDTGLLLSAAFGESELDVRKDDGVVRLPLYMASLLVAR